MKACCCCLPLINPEACKNCGNNDFSEINSITYPKTDWIKPVVMPLTPEEELIFKPKTKKEIIEKFDKDGKLIERITKEI